MPIYTPVWRFFFPRGLALLRRCLPFHPVALGGLTSEHQICGAVAAASILGISGALVVLVWRASGASVATAVLFFWVSYLVLLLPCLQLLQHGDPVSCRCVFSHLFSRFCTWGTENTDFPSIPYSTIPCITLYCPTLPCIASLALHDITLHTLWFHCVHCID